MTTKTVEFTDEVEANRIAYSDQLRLALVVGREWGVIDEEHLTPFFKSLEAFEAGDDVMISAYQVEAALRPHVRKMQKASGWRPDQIRTSGVQIHVSLSQWLWEQKIPNFLAVGNIIKDGERVYHPTLDSLKSKLVPEVDASASIDAHAWLTFPDMSIIDATWWFCEHQSNLPKTFSWPDRVHCGEPVVENRTYHAMVIGTKFQASDLRLPPWLQK